MRQKRRKEPKYYRIRASLLWSGIVFTITAMGIICFGKRIFEKWQKGQERIKVSYEGLESELIDTSSCFLCGSSDMSLMDYFRKFDTIGLISLNDWYILDFKLKSYDEQGIEICGEGHGTTWGNTGEICYMSESYPSRGMACIKVTLQDNYDLDATVIKTHLCQTCLDKVTVTLNYSQWKYEQKNVIPLCLVDFDTLEIYSLQDWHVGCSIRDYWVEMEFNENEVEVKAFYLPKR